MFLSLAGILMGMERDAKRGSAYGIQKVLEGHAGRR
jgi:hypothetical protein